MKFAESAHFISANERRKEEKILSPPSNENVYRKFIKIAVPEQKPNGLHFWPVSNSVPDPDRMTVHDAMTAGVGTSMPHHHLSRSRFMITDILSGHSGQRSPPSPASSDGPRDLSLHSRDSELSDGHESGTDSGLPGENSSVCSNGECEGDGSNLRAGKDRERILTRRDDLLTLLL